ncbi:MAG TPA: response regulator transcription factor [Candidatus Limnocylindrales bacterium]|jgi:FixJ family two-component response regulator|nr:response regulator transcription factor [Candidatus Limnocylindrales bacterium]
MNTNTGKVYVVDDDPSMRKAMGRLCHSAGFEVKMFASAREFLDREVPASPACLVLDVHLPGLSGLDLQAELAARHIQTPIVFITGQGDIPTTVRAMRAGAVDFLTKPFRNQDLLTVIRAAISKDQQLQPLQAEREALQRRLATLTPREREVFDHVIKGFLNKQIADDLGASEQTIKVHRGRVMQKMQVSSVAELVQAAVKLGVLKT